MSEKLYESIEIGPGKRHLRDWGDKVFLYCTFEDVDTDGIMCDGALLHCSLHRVKLYWGFFNCAVLHHVEFVDCVFPGTSFRGCTLSACTFRRCSFILDNLGGSCTIDDCFFAECAFEDCTFVHRQGQGQSIFESRNRIYASTTNRCRGLAGVAGLS